MMGLVILLAVGFALAWGGMVIGTCMRLTHPPRRTYAWAVSKGLPGDPGELPPPNGPRAFESFDLAARLGGSWRSLVGRERNGESLVPCWDIVGDTHDGPVVIATPGWGESKVNVLVRLAALGRLASRVVVWDPQGLGEAPGVCALGTREHLVLARLIEYVSSTDNNPEIVLFGWSMGGGVSIVAAANDERVRGVIAEAPYRVARTPAKNVMQYAGLPWTGVGPAAFALMGLVKGVGASWRDFDRAEHAAKLTCPLLVIHGDQDVVCPLDDGRVIADAAPKGQLVVIVDGGHNDLWTEPRFASMCSAAVEEFIRASVRSE